MRMKNLDTKRKQNKNQNGRPPNSKGVPQDKKRETKPKGMAWIVSYEQEKAKALEHIEAVEKIISAQILMSKGKKTKRSLTKHECKGIEEITFAVASHIDSSVKLKLDLEIVKGILKRINRVDGVVFSNYQTLKVDNMPLEDRKLAMASAIALASVGE